MALLTLLFGRGYLLLTTSVTERAGRQVDSELIRLTGSIPPEIWNRVGNKLIPKLRTGESLEVSVGLTVKVSAGQGPQFLAEVRQILAELGLEDRSPLTLSLHRGSLAATWRRSRASFYAVQLDVSPPADAVRFAATGAGERSRSTRRVQRPE